MSDTTLIERHPDKRASDSKTFIEDSPKGVVWALEVFNLGAIVMRAHLEHGQWVFDGVSIFTKDEIQFDDAYSHARTGTS